MQTGSSLLLEDRRRRETRSLPGTLARLVYGAYYLTVSDVWCLMLVSQCYWATRSSSTTDGGLSNDERLKPGVACDASRCQSPPLLTGGRQVDDARWRAGETSAMARIGDAV